MEEDIEKKENKLEDSSDNIINENNMLNNSNIDNNIEDSTNNVLKEEIIDTTDPNKKKNEEINSLDIDTTDPNKKVETEEEKKSEQILNTENQNNVVPNQNVVDNNSNQKRQNVKKEKLSFKGCLSEFAVTAHHTSLEDLLNKNYILTSHGNRLSSQMKEDILNNKKINSNSLIVIDANKKPRKIYYDKKNGVISDKPIEDELAFQDKQAFKWYKLIIAAFYFLAKLIKAIISLAKFPLKLNEKACLDRALKNAFKVDQKKNEKIEGKEKAKDINKQKEIKKEEVKENNKIEEKVDEKNIDKEPQNLENQENKDKELEDNKDLNKIDDNLEKEENLEDNIDNEIDTNSQKDDDVSSENEEIESKNDVYVNKTNDPILNLENEILIGEENELNLKEKNSKKSFQRLDKEPELDKELDNRLIVEDKKEISLNLEEKYNSLNEEQKQFVNNEIKTNDIKDIQVIDNDVILKVSNNDNPNKEQLLIGALKDNINLDDIKNDNNLVMNLEKTNEAKIENKQ